MQRHTRALPLLSLCVFLAAGLASAVLVQAQEWTTSGFNAQRTSWLPSDDRLTKSAVESGEFRFLWKSRIDNQARQLNSLTPPVLLDRLIGYRGFKSLAFVGGSADRVFALDTDLARPYWTTSLNYSAANGGQAPSSLECPGGLTAMPSRRTTLMASAFGRGGGGGRGARSGSAVGEPGRGAAVLAEPPRGRGAAPVPARGARAGGARAAVPPVPFGGVDPLYVVGSDGFLHVLRVSNGSDAAPAVPFLPPGSRPSALIFVDGLVYTTTSNNCGAAPNAVWAIDLTTPETTTVTHWETGGPNVVGNSGPAFGADGTVYIAVGPAPQSAAARLTTAGTRVNYANSVVALDRYTLTPKDWFTAPGVEFNASPIVVRYKDRDLVAVTGNDGRLYLLDGTALGGANHQTPLHVTAKYTAPGVGASLATWEDPTARWIVAAASGAVPAAMTFAANGPAPSGSVVTFKVVDTNGSVALMPGWSSRNIAASLTPIVVNGLVFAVASGEYRGPVAGLSAAQRARQSTSASLYVLDGLTGKQLWTSGATITSFARGGLTAGGGQVYLVTYDNTLYAFGIPMEH